jgi:hypothetical protein
VAKDMGKDSKKKGDDKGVKLDIRQETEGQVRVDAAENLSYKEYAKLRSEPIITVQRIIDRRAKPPEMKKDKWPNMEIRQVVLWGEIPKETPKSERTAATVKSYILHVPPAPKPPPKGIGSMDPPGG